MWKTHKKFGNLSASNYIKLCLIVLCLSFTGIASAESNEADNVNEASIEDLQHAYNQQLDKYNQSKNELERVYTEIRATKAKLQALDTEKANSLSALEDIQRIDRENPNLELSSKVEDAKERNRIAFSHYNNEAQHLKELQIQSISLDKQVKDEIIVLNDIARNIKKAHDEIIAEEVEKRISKFKRSSVVEGQAEVGCADESPRKCQQRARRSAERDASEKGSIVVVNAATNIENFQLTQDQVKTEVQAQLSNVEVIEKGWMGDTTYKYHIRAEVTPIISSTLREQIEESIAHELGIVVPEEVSLSEVSTAKATKKSTTGKKRKSAAEESFAELDRETGHSKTDIEREEKKQRAKIKREKARKSAALDDERRRIFGAW